MKTSSKAFFVIFIISISFLAFLYGASAIHFKIFPYHQIRQVFFGVKALSASVLGSRDLINTDLYAENRRDRTGVITHDLDRAEDDLVLWTSGHSQVAYLMKPNGEIVHEWHFPFSEAWSDPPHVPTPMPEEYIYWSNIHLYPNGDLLAMYHAEGVTPAGYGLIKIDKESNLLWKYADHVHHDMTVGDDGRIYTLDLRFGFDPIPGVRKVEPPFIDDGLVVLSPDGERIARYSLLESFRDSDYRTMLDLIVENERGDPLHSNEVELVSAEFAAANPFVKEGQIITCLREIDSIAVIDPETGEVVWALRGPWRAPHDPDFLPDGKMMIFDNRGHFGPGGKSRTLEFDPNTQEILWTYAGDEENVLFSAFMAFQERLPNGNTHITESAHGRMLEVTSDGEIVWEFVNTNTATSSDDHVAMISASYRVDPASLTFLTPAANEG